jgi:hypothetical protein
MAGTGDHRSGRTDAVSEVVGPKQFRINAFQKPPPAGLFQTEEGLKGTSKTGGTSFLGHATGDIKVETDGVKNYRISGEKRTARGINIIARPSRGIATSLQKRFSWTGFSVLLTAGFVVAYHHPAILGYFISRGGTIIIKFAY